MSSANPLGILHNVTSQHHFMETLSSMMYSETTEKEEEEEGGLETRGRNRDLKSYLIESNEAGLPETFAMGSYIATVQPTDVSHIKILAFREANMEMYYSFYVDQSDKRFWILHTQALADKTHNIVKRFVSQRKYQLDRAWIPKHLLNKMSQLPGNKFDGIDTDFSDYFNPDGELSGNTLRLGAHGEFAQKAKQAIENKKAGLEEAIPYEAMRITRGKSDGAEPAFSSDDVTYEGLLSVKSGKSIDHHISLVDQTKNEYRELIEDTENYRLRTKQVGDFSRIEGRSIDIAFERKIEDFNLFLGRLLDSKLPFRLWGINQKIASDYYRVFALDLHSGHPLDLEVAPNWIRIYLPNGSCGNSVLRLYVNLQHYYDSRTISEEINA